MCYIFWLLMYIDLELTLTSTKDNEGSKSYETSISLHFQVWIKCFVRYFIYFLFLWVSWTWISVKINGNIFTLNTVTAFTKSDADAEIFLLSKINCACGGVTYTACIDTPRDRGIGSSPLWCSLRDIIQCTRPVFDMVIISFCLSCNFAKYFHGISASLIHAFT